MKSPKSTDRDVIDRVLRKRFRDRSDKVLRAVTTEILEELQFERAMTRPADDRVIEDRYRAQMEALYRRLDDELNPTGDRRIAFCLLLREFDSASWPGYMSNVERSSMLDLLRKFLEYMERNP